MSLHPLFVNILRAHGIPQGSDQCERCTSLDEVHDANCPHHDDYDPTPYCSYCGARKRSQCKCGPTAENE